ncbi:MAG: ion transporter [Pseudomonadales bacterium]|jgi:voltage-gated potassium channel|nr:ion transporter [Pseudomonadales bacterium]
MTRETETMPPSDDAPESLRERVRRVIFESTPGAPRQFDVILMVAIAVSVVAVLLDSVPEIHARWGRALLLAEWGFTILFTLEYGVRLWCIERPLLYARSFYGIIDLLGILPTWLSLVVGGTQYLLVVRILRVLRVFRVLRMVRWVTEASFLMDALMASRRKIVVFLFAVLTLVVVFGSVVYLVEGPEAPFTSIPISIYWAIVTLTTVGYGDIAPVTPLGRALAACIMIMGYGIIAVPTGIVTVELNEAMRRQRVNSRVCSGCSAEGHNREARFCWRCGQPFEAPPST